MSENLAIGCAVPPARAGPRHDRWTVGANAACPGGRWLLDGILEFQPAMFTRAFPATLAGTSPVNPAFEAKPITWSATLIDAPPGRRNPGFCHHPAGLGRHPWPAYCPAGAGRVGAVVAGGVVPRPGPAGAPAGTASLTDGAPGAVFLYARSRCRSGPRSARPALSPPALAV